MNTFKINITPEANKRWGYCVTTNRGKEYLFHFWKSDVSDDVWYFLIPDRTPEAQGKKIIDKLWVTSTDIPTRHIIEFVRSILTIRYGLIDLDIQLTHEAKRILKVK